MNPIKSYATRSGCAVVSGITLPGGSWVQARLARPTTRSKKRTIIIYNQTKLTIRLVRSEHLAFSVQRLLILQLVVTPGGVPRDHIEL